MKLFKIQNSTESSGAELRSIFKAFRKALFFAFILEAVLVGISIIYIFSGGVGPCGPSNDIPVFVQLIHQPGSWLANLFADEHSLNHSLLSLVITIGFLSILSHIGLRIVNAKKSLA